MSMFFASSVIDQVRMATKKQNRLATFAGFLIGGFVPCATFFVVHEDVVKNSLMWAIVVGGLIFSAKTVFDWSRIAFQSPAKALGFCILVEGVMTFSSLLPLSVAALVLLATVNGIATGCNLALNQAAMKASLKTSSPKKKKGKENGNEREIMAEELAA